MIRGCSSSIDKRTPSSIGIFAICPPTFARATASSAIMQPSSPLAYMPRAQPGGRLSVSYCDQRSPRSLKRAINGGAYSGQAKNYPWALLSAEKDFLQQLSWRKRRMDSCASPSPPAAATSSPSPTRSAKCPYRLTSRDATTTRLARLIASAIKPSMLIAATKSRPRPPLLDSISLRNYSVNSPLRESARPT